MFLDLHTLRLVLKRYTFAQLELPEAQPVLTVLILIFRVSHSHLIVQEVLQFIPNVSSILPIPSGWRRAGKLLVYHRLLLMSNWRRWRYHVELVSGNWHMTNRWRIVYHVSLLSLLRSHWLQHFTLGLSRRCHLLLHATDVLQIGTTRRLLDLVHHMSTF